MPAKKVFLFSLTVACTLVIVVANLTLWREGGQFPSINGVFLAQPRPLPDFKLVNQNGEIFTAKGFEGQWSILTYGFTSCPDVCPMIMMDLQGLQTKMDKDRGNDKDSERVNANIIFYSVDPERDSVEKLNTYLNFFNPNFVGLVAENKKSYKAEAFEQAMGFTYRVLNNGDSLHYDVAHGLEIFIVNPEGRLQAVLKPIISPEGLAGHEAELLYRDFKKVKKYYYRKSSSKIASL